MAHPTDEMRYAFRELREAEVEGRYQEMLYEQRRVALDSALQLLCAGEANGDVVELAERIAEFLRGGDALSRMNAQHALNEEG